MTFSEKLNEYIILLDCTSKELADASGLSASVLSRYRSGSRTPEAGSDTLQLLAAGISRLGSEKGRPELTETAVLQALTACARPVFPYEQLQNSLNTLISALNLNVSDLSRSLNYDTSYISRIRNGQRRPADPEKFARDISRYVVRKVSAASEESTLAQLLGKEPDSLRDSSVCLTELTRWLTSGQNPKDDVILPFLTKVDEFDLNEFTRSIHFDKLKVPTMPFQLPTSKNYYGLAEMRQGELDFFKAAVLSKSMEPLIMNDDTPMADKTQGTDFMKKFIFAVALALKKGLQVNMIHNVNRPFEEMMIGLEGWIPMYMTGQISPYYLKGIHNTIFGHLLFSSGTAALSGECIMGCHDHGKFYLTTSKAETAYYRQRAQDLLSKASPLMDIYRAESANHYRTFLRTDTETHGPRHNILSALPLYTISDHLLETLLDRAGLSAGDRDRDRVRSYAADQRARMEQLLQRDQVTDELPLLTQAEFDAHPMLLPLSGLFLELDIPYTYQDYLVHKGLTEEFAASHPGYTVRFTAAACFRNIQITILEGHWAVISKNKAPAIHFVIRHPKLLSAIENFVVPLHNGAGETFFPQEP